MGKLRVRLVGFAPDKTKEVHSHLSAALEEIERRVGRSLKFPSPVRPMTAREMTHGRTIKSQGHKGGAGHGVWDSLNNEVRVNPFMSAQDILLNVVHELLHAAMAGSDEESIDRLAGQVMNSLRLMERVPSSLYRKISEALSSKTVKRIRKIRRNRKLPDSSGNLSPEDAKYLPGLVGSTAHSNRPPSGGPGSYRPGIIRHS